MFNSQFDFEGHEIIPLEPDLNLEYIGFNYVEEGIRVLVKTLWKIGYKTACSCAGHVKNLEPYPWVVIPVNLAQDQFLNKLAIAVARYNMSLGKDGGMPRAIDTWSLIPIIATAGFMIYLQPTDINRERSTARISELRKSSSDLATFIEKNCVDIFLA
ncbi:MAG: hypothetical protein WCK48_02340 [bacterium]